MSLLSTRRDGFATALSMSKDGPSAYALEVNQALLKEDDDLLRQTFLSVFRHHHPQLANKVDVIFALSQAWCMSESDDDFDMLVKRLESLKPDEHILVASAFSQLLNLHNLTEEIVTARVEKAARLGEVEQSTRSTNKSLERLVNELGQNPEDIFKALCRQRVDIVFTAHPTQAIRQSLLKKYQKIRSEMDALHNTRMTPYERLECLDEIKSQIQAAWRTDEIRRKKPTPQDESRQGLSYFHDTIFHGLPVFLRRIDTALKNIGQPMLPLDTKLFNFGAWMGGDRDGNPFVTAATTRDVVLGARLSATMLLQSQISRLVYELSVWRASDELTAAAARILEARKDGLYAHTTRESYETEFGSVREPFRVVLSEIRERLNSTSTTLRYLMSHPHLNVKETLDNDPGAYSDAEAIITPLMLCYDSLVATGDSTIAFSELTDVIRQAQTFGLHLCQLDIRQESTKHAEAIDAITTYLGLGSFNAWDEAQRTAFLLKELEERRPLLPADLPMSEEVADVIGTFKMLATLPSDSLGAYIISMAHTASDVLAVLLLQKECGIRETLRVVPLFETLDDLEYAETAMEQLFGNAWYHAHIAGAQECMIGYSDSGKDAGRLAAAWGLYEVQERLAAVAAKYDVHLTLFHGRGGTVGRGGGPAHLAILSQPPKTISGTLRVTVQGEVMEQQFGEKEIAFRTMDLYTSAVLEATLAPMEEPQAVWREAMREMSRTSCEAYRAVVRHDPRFIEYFQTLTPVNELGRMNIGSRPAKRKAHGSIDTLRAIPWIFAWTQIRFHLPVWLGMGQALRAMIDAGKLELLQDMYQNWMFFRVTLDMLEMVFAKADPRVVTMYQRQLVDAGLHALGDELLRTFYEAEELVLKVMKHKGLLSSSSTAFLQQKLQLRAPYVAPLNILQVYCLKTIRDIEAGKEVDESGYKPDPAAVALMSRDPEKTPFVGAVEDTLIITMKGIAAGMQNTG
ncbi:PEPCL1 [Auxenochlorella protothecoides x Auxenochlorella symbiontica]